MPNVIGSNRAGSRVTEQANQYGANKVSQFVGVAAEDKAINSKELKVFIKDLLPFYSGPLKAKQSEHEIDVKNYTGTLKLSNVVTATWYGNNSNRLYPPDVKKGEQVTVYLYSDQDKYYWDSLGRDDDKRRTERQMIAVANTPDGPTPVNAENSYGLLMDTQEEKTVKLMTSNSAGERFKYMACLDGKNEKIGIWDDANNEIVIESAVPRVYMRNSDGTMIELSKKNLTMIVPEDLLIKVGRQAIFDIPALSMVNTRGGGTTIWEANDMVMKCANGLVIESNKIGLKGYVEASNIVSGHHYATGYSTITGGMSRAFGRIMAATAVIAGKYSTYDMASINKFDGSVTNSSASPNTDGGGDAHNRHSTAFEDFRTTIELICKDLERIDAVVGYGNNTAGIRAAAEAAIMKISKGE